MCQKSGQPYVAVFLEDWARGGGSWPATPLKKLRVTQITEVASVNGEEKAHLRGDLQKKKAKKQSKAQTQPQSTL